MSRHDRPSHAEPYAWPYDGDLRPDNTALIVIDMQTDFCGEGGYVDKMGYDISLTRAPIEPIARADGGAARRCGFHIIHTREGHRPDLADLPANKRWRSRQIGTDGVGIGDDGPVRPHPGARRAGLGDHPRAGAAAGRGRHRQARQGLLLRHRPRTDPAHARHRNLMLAGITTDVCVHTTMREANDRGFECLLLSDCTAATDHGNHLAALKMITMQGGVFGARRRPRRRCSRRSA